MLKNKETRTPQNTHTHTDTHRHTDTHVRFGSRHLRPAGRRSFGIFVIHPVVVDVLLCRWPSQSHVRPV